MWMRVWVQQCVCLLTYESHVYVELILFILKIIMKEFALGFAHTNCVCVFVSRCVCVCLFFSVTVFCEQNKIHLLLAWNMCACTHKQKHSSGSIWWKETHKKQTNKQKYNWNRVKDEEEEKKLSSVEYTARKFEYVFAYDSRPYGERYVGLRLESAKNACIGK